MSIPGFASWLNGSPATPPLLAAAGLSRLGFSIQPDGQLLGPGSDVPGAASSPPVPEGLRARPLPVEVMVPCVGQAAIGLERRCGDKRLAEVCDRLNHRATFQCVTAERTFLRALGEVVRARSPRWPR
ncbi:MAG: hypothetical protein M5U12_18960 [Verrucomicrobia bacterium]|nr:hypothetical protein [Verrucomicrobiota bacterium]